MDPELASPQSLSRLMDVQIPLFNFPIILFPMLYENIHYTAIAVDTIKRMAIFYDSRSDRFPELADHYRKVGDSPPLPIIRQEHALTRF
jgi:hypothetical protein